MRKPGDAVTGIAATRAAADEARFEDDDIASRVGQQRRQRRADDPTADDGDVGYDALVLDLSRPRSRVLPE